MRLRERRYLRSYTTILTILHAMILSDPRPWESRHLDSGADKDLSGKIRPAPGVLDLQVILVLGIIRSNRGRWGRIHRVLHTEGSVKEMKNEKAAENASICGQCTACNSSLRRWPKYAPLVDNIIQRIEEKYMKDSVDIQLILILKPPQQITRAPTTSSPKPGHILPKRR